MARFFIADKNIIVNVIVADTKQIAEQVTGLTAIESGDFEVIGANKGATFDPTLKFYVNPKPYKSWVMNTETRIWEAPVSRPQDGLRYTWDEELVDWAATDFTESA